MSLIGLQLLDLNNHEVKWDKDKILRLVNVYSNVCKKKTNKMYI